MFEQSLLTQTGTQNKSAFLASFSAQIALAGVLVIVPLLSHEVLPAISMVNHLTLDYRPSPPTPTAVAPQKHTSARRSFSDVLLAPILAPRTPAEPAVFTPAPADDSSRYAGDFTGSPFGTLPIHTGATVLLQPPPPPKPAATPVAEPIAPAAPIRVTSEIQAAKILKRVLPTYPTIAKAARIQGTVRLVGTIAKDGTIQNLQVISGHPILAQAALDAVRQWVYKPTILNSQPVEVIAPIDVTFTLQ
jgi:protein TonB